jgi:endonuclease III
MRVDRPVFRELITTLETIHGRKRPRTIDPFEMVLRENVAYLVDDDRREEAFRRLREEVGLTPEAILKAPKAALYGVTKLGGMHPEQRVDRLRDIARIAVAEFPDGVKSALDLPPAQAKKLFRKFPSFGDPGAEKILLFNGRLAVLALDSNGLRVLLRLGFGEESRNYSTSYRSAQKAVREEVPDADRALFTRAHLLLRAHGKETCKTSSPRCEICPLSKGCRHFADHR